MAVGEYAHELTIRWRKAGTWHLGEWITFLSLSKTLRPRRRSSSNWASTLEGESTVEGPLVGSLIGLTDVRATLAMMRTPDGQGIELDKFHTPQAIRFGPVDAPVNTLGVRRVMFAVDGIDEVMARMLAHGSELIGQMR